MSIRDGAGGKEGGCDGNGGGHSEAVKLTELLTWKLECFYMGMQCSLVSVLRTSSFAENYARSHFVKLHSTWFDRVYASHSSVAKDTFIYIGMTIISWFLVFAKAEQSWER